ncbi:alpha-tocopherol transfer protein-like [Folsomia candida]|uniref:alpha-tocopherol transfer protein-like n=1 Tax=Folsomia candida TaxID=158441 RepID=UPI000B8F9DCB|nr:alpha-tocopherol transfer protein-like [Folsomia candida]
MLKSTSHVEEKEQSIEKQLKELLVLLEDSKDFKKFGDLFDDKFLKQFIRGKKYDTVKACEYIQNYLYLRTDRFAEFSRTLRPSITPLINHGMLRMLKRSDQEGRIVVLDRVSRWDVSIFDAECGIRNWVLMADEILRSLDAACSKGVVVLLDFGDYSYSQARLLTPSVVLRAMNMLVNCMPMRYKGVHFINHGHLVNMLVTGVRPFLKKKLRNRIHTHSSTASLHAHIASDILPECYDGQLTEDDAFDEEFEKRIFTREDFYEKFAERIQSPGKA